MTQDTCATCRHGSSYKRPKILEETGFDDQLMFDDKDETVYVCRAPDGPHANAEQLVPITCSSWAPPTAGRSRLEELDRMIAARENRMRQGEKER